MASRGLTGPTPSHRHASTDRHGGIRGPESARRFGAANANRHYSKYQSPDITRKDDEKMLLSAPHQTQNPESALILKASVFYTTAAIVAVIILLFLIL